MRLQTKQRYFIASSFIIGSVLLGLGTGCLSDPYVRKQEYLESGKRYAAKGKLQEAVIQFSNALKVDHNFGDAHYQLGRAYIREGMLQAGYVELIRTVDLEPTNLQARSDLGGLSLAGGDPVRATVEAKAILAAQPGNADAYALLAGIAWSKGDHAEAVAQIQHALALDPKRAGFHATLGLIESSDPSIASSAEEQMRKSITLDPNNSTARLVLASLLARKGDLGGAEEQDKVAIAIDPKSLGARSSLAAVYLKQGDKTNAEGTLRQATEQLADTERSAQLLQSYYTSTSQFDHGAAVYADLVSKHPKSIPLKLAYAHLLIKKGDTTKAKAVAADLSKASSANPEVATLNALLLLQDGKVNEAFDILQKAAEHSPESVQVKLSLGRVAIAAGNTAVAEQSFRDAARISPANLEAEQGLAQLASQQKNFNRLLAISNATLSAHPNFTQAYVWRAIAEANAMQVDKANTDFQLALKKDPQNAAAYLGLGEILLVQRQFSKGIAMLEQALVYDPNAARALRLLVLYDLHMKQPGKAIARIEQQIARTPNNQEMYNQLSELQIDTGDISAALATTDKAMQLTPLDSATVMAYSHAQILHGDVGKVILIWQQWLEKHPNNPQVYALLGTLEQSRGDQIKAAGYYDKALQIQPDQPVAANNLAYLMTEGGHNEDRALSLAQSARRSMPDSSSTADTLAWVYYHKGMYTAARDLLEDAIKTAPDNPSIQYHLGMTYSRLSDGKDATLHLTRAAMLAPNTRMAKDADKMLH